MNILVAMETKPYQRVWLEEAAPGETFIYKEGKAEREDVQNADVILGNVSPKLISTGDKLKWTRSRCSNYNNRPKTHATFSCLQRATAWR